MPAVRDGDADDGLVVARLVAGDDSALAIVYARYGGFVFGLARRVTGSESLARDITQDVFTLLWEQPDRIDLGRGTLRAWLGVVTHRRSVNEIRGAARRRAREAKVATSEASGTDAQAELVETTTQRWRAGRLRDFVMTLPDEQRRALELAYFDGCTYRDVAERLGIPEGTAKSRLRLALARLRSMLEAQPLEAWQ